MKSTELKEIISICIYNEHNLLHFVNICPLNHLLMVSYNINHIEEMNFDDIENPYK